VIALAQNSLAMAFNRFRRRLRGADPGVYRARQHVALFAYYLLLGVAIAAIAWVRAWRALNLLGFSPPSASPLCGACSSTSLSTWPAPSRS
jgi:hypothetical protein